MLNRPFNQQDYRLSERLHHCLQRDFVGNRDMFLLRSAFWLTVVVMLIPADPQTGEAPRITVLNALMAAQATVADLGDFCSRNPDVCLTGSAAIDVFAEQAGNGVDLIYRYFGGPEDKAGSPGTLTTDDLALPWQGGIPDDSV